MPQSTGEPRFECQRSEKPFGPGWGTDAIAGARWFDGAHGIGGWRFALPPWSLARMATPVAHFMALTGISALASNSSTRLLNFYS